VISAVMIALLLAPRLTDRTLPDEHSVEGTAINCSIQDGLKQQDEVSWKFPSLVLADKAASGALNAAIARDVRKALRIASFAQGSPCKEVDEEMQFESSDYCWLTYASERYVSLGCQTTGRHLHGREGATNRTLLFRIRGPKVTQVEARSLFKDSAAVARVTDMLAHSIRDDVATASTDDRNSGVSDDEIPALSREMFESATLMPRAIHFEVLGSRRGVAFEATLDCKAVGLQLALAIRRELGCHKP
jgi:hypothetical protein